MKPRTLLISLCAIAALLLTGCVQAVRASAGAGLGLDGAAALGQQWRGRGLDHVLRPGLTLGSRCPARRLGGGRFTQRAAVGFGRAFTTASITGRAVTAAFASAIRPALRTAFRTGFTPHLGTGFGPAFAARPTVGAIAPIFTGLDVAAPATPFTPAATFAAAVATALAAA